MSIFIYQNFAVRLYINAKHGNPMGAGRTNPVLFTGSVVFPDASIKHFIDLANFDQMDHSVPMPDYRAVALAMASKFLNYTPEQSQDFVAGQLFDLGDGKKLIDGLIVQNTLTQKGKMVIFDDSAQIVCDCDLYFRPCKMSDGRGKAPDLLATNYDVTGGQRTNAASIGASISASQALEMLKQRSQR